MPASDFQYYPRRTKWITFAWLAVIFIAFASFSRAGEVFDRNPYFLIESWQDHEGLPESSALAISQTPDGYLWVGTAEGLVRFNGISFLRAEKLSDFTRLNGFISFLQTDRSGRMWAGGEGRLALYDHGVWQRIGGTNVSVRSVAEDKSGKILIGGGEGQLYNIVNGAVNRLSAPSGVKPSGVFCITDAKDGLIWLANKGFIGRQSSTDWTRFGASNTVPPTLVAAPAQNGGVWIYTPGELRRFQADGTITSFPAPSLDQPRDMIEDRDGTIWITTITHGLARFVPGGTVSFIDSTNGLTHNSIRSVYEDREGNIWAGGSLNGLNRLKARQFVTIDRAEGLPDNAVRTIAETAQGQILVGTHGGGMARIHDYKAEAVPSVTRDTQDEYVWSLLEDRNGRLWIGTYSGGLFVEEHGIRRPFPLPGFFRNSVAQLMEDSYGRIWVGGPGGLGIIEGDQMTKSFTNSVIADFATTCLVEDTNRGVIWVGTYGHGVYEMDARHLDQIKPLTELPGNRISSLALDNDGFLWIGIFEQGLACYHNGKVFLIGAAQGLPAQTIGSVLDDGRGSFWLGTTMGIFRVARTELHRLAEPSSPLGVFNLFNVSDGLGSEDCAEGYQPNSLRDHSGRLWFSTDRGVVTVDPAHLRLNTIPPPVKIEGIKLTDRSGNHIALESTSGQLSIPPGSTELEFDFVGLSYTAPEKIQFKYQLEGAGKNWIDIGTTRELHFRELAHGHYVLHLAAANNDGVWNEAGTAFAFAVRPFFWQTLWFRLLALGVVAAACGFAVRRFTRWQFQQRIDQMQRKRVAEQQAEAEIQRREKYFRSLIEHASDSITVINPKADITYQSTSGERILGYPAESILGRNLIEMVHPEDLAKARAAIEQSLAQFNVPVKLTARLRHQDGSWHTIETLGTSIQDDSGERQVILNSRDVTENLKLEEQLRQAQKMEAIGRLAGGVAHDFNNILSSLLMQNELISMSANLPPDVHEGLQQIAADTNRAADLTRQLLLFSRRQVMQSRLLDLNEVVNNMARMLQRVIREDVLLQLALHPTPLLTVADPSMIEQVVLNLAVNARDAMAKGGRLRIETSETVLDANTARANPDAKPGRYVCLRVTDTGGGIAPEILPRIFEPFFTTKEAGKGTGLGLATVFGIVQQHHGWIDVENLPGRGVTFHVFLPESDEKNSEPSPSSVKAKPRGGTETILVVEDETAVRRTVRLMLERYGYQILEAADAADALKLWPANRETVALLLTDLVMPGEMGGRELGRKLKKEQPRLKVIFASGYSPDIAGRDFQLDSGEAFVQKPFATDHLLETIRRCLDA